MTETAMKLLIPMAYVAGLSFACAAVGQVTAATPAPDAGRWNEAVPETAAKMPQAPAEPEKKAATKKKSAKQPADMERAKENARGDAIEGGAGAVIDPCKIKDLPECNKAVVNPCDIRPDLPECQH
ncbi:hypothetical protein [Sulfurisoma sediminicola]|uniref:Kazal-type serine protease inhibitor-like protein n=1 Tax=Sulfurisoma sediminicola TaxID=1381557 RepID=A0A497XGE9_9PROT|nr:hypothetical protein [Sulfurisoma sediminicola]RLJ65087.1 hypothetical protein DFR35_1743 [Sulfurisoma sediminicola]